MFSAQMKMWLHLLQYWKTNSYQCTCRWCCTVSLNMLMWGCCVHVALHISMHSDLYVLGKAVGPWMINIHCPSKSGLFLSIRSIDQSKEQVWWMHSFCRCVTEPNLSEYPPHFSNSTCRYLLNACETDEGESMEKPTRTRLADAALKGSLRGQVRSLKAHLWILMPSFAWRCCPAMEFGHWQPFWNINTMYCLKYSCATRMTLRWEGQVVRPTESTVLRQIIVNSCTTYFKLSIS